MMARKVSRVVATIAVVAGMLLGLLGWGTVYSFQYSKDEYERCLEIPEPEGTDDAYVSNATNEGWNYLPIGLHCSWELKNGEIVSEDYPELVPNVLVYGGLALALAGIASLTLSSRKEREKL
jgi:hypothetical protein